MGLMKKARKSGEATRYINRNRAAKKLQLNLGDFRQLCILKGIYPREPKSRKKVQNGNSIIQTLYFKKDIRFLMHEPIIWKFREMKIFSRRLRKAYDKTDFDGVKRVRNSRPFYKVDHIVRERYPNFVDAVADLDDALSMCFLFARMPKNPKISMDLIRMCNRLTIEFMNYIIEAKALRKVFISIKGYYYQVEVMGETITWVVPHPFAPDTPAGVDLSVMVTFCDFYLTLLGFVNFRLFNSLSLHYPPKLIGIQDAPIGDDDLTSISEHVASLNFPLARISQVDDTDEAVTIDTHLMEEGDERLVALKVAEEKIIKLQNLFKGLKFFLGREINRESLTFIIKCCSGEVSWDESLGVGSTYAEVDQTITHQIVDRPNYPKTYLSRYYLQPQWVYDSINAGFMLPVQEYFSDVDLPAHLSPFHSTGEVVYVPPEKKRLDMLQKAAEKGNALPIKQVSGSESESDSSSDESDDDGQNNMSGDEDESKDLEGSEEKEELANEEEAEDEETKKKREELEKIIVQRGVPVKVNNYKLSKKERQQSKKARVMMIPKKKKRLYMKLLKKEGIAARKATKLAERRKQYDSEQAAMNKSKKKEKRNEFYKELIDKQKQAAK